MNRLSALGSSDSQVNSQPSSPVAPSSAPAALTQRIDRPQRFFLPARYEANYRYPLVVWLHSDGYNENQICQVMPHISLQNYVGVGIRGSRSVDPVGHRFDWSSQPAAVSRCEDAIWRALDDATERYSIHPDRIFLAGYAAGGTMARRVALRHPSAFAGCISLGGRFPRGGGVLSNLAAARALKSFWAVAIGNPELPPQKFEEDIALASAARLRIDIRRYTVQDEMVREVLRDVDAWIMGRVTGAETLPFSSTWETEEVSFSAN